MPNSEQSYKGKVKIGQQPENCEHRNDPDLVQAFLKKWWVESDFKAPNPPLSLRLKGSGCHYNSIYNKIAILSCALRRGNYIMTQEALFFYDTRSVVVL